MSLESERPEAPFSESTRRTIRERYNYRCSVCLQSVIRGQCAHLFPQAADGQTQVWKRPVPPFWIRTHSCQVEEAVVLGILDSKYDRDRGKAFNATLVRLPLPYFTKGLLVWSPPIDVLRWIVNQMAGKRETMGMREIFSALESKAAAQFPGAADSLEATKFPEKLRHLQNNYSLIPIFKSKYPCPRYDIYCGLPPLSVLVGGEFRQLPQDLQPRKGQMTYRIFNSIDPTMRSILAPKAFECGVVSFSRFQSKDDASPLDYWCFPPDCNEADKIEPTTEPSRPEILLAQEIYRKLREVKNIQDRRRAMDPKSKEVPVAAKPTDSKAGPLFLLKVAQSLIHLKAHSTSESVLAARSHPAKHQTDNERRPPTMHNASEPAIATVGSPSRGAISHQAQSEPLIQSPPATPRKGPCGVHDAKGHRRHYCSKCQVVVWQQAHSTRPDLDVKRNPMTG
ncbi:hypothetical protein B0H13DRAFT_1908349 [Mycena leptocephala]|nr:hypothetical protein B0H13DRAFT_1908349 [Mycena leptocephala]